VAVSKLCLWQLASCILLASCRPLASCVAVGKLYTVGKLCVYRWQALCRAVGKLCVGQLASCIGQLASCGCLNTALVVVFTASVSCNTNSFYTEWRQRGSATARSQWSGGMSRGCKCIWRFWHWHFSHYVRSTILICRHRRTSTEAWQPFGLGNARSLLRRLLLTIINRPHRDPVLRKQDPSIIHSPSSPTTTTLPVSSLSHPDSLALTK
jgi:hypothetical protein